MSSDGGAPPGVGVGGMTTTPGASRGARAPCAAASPAPSPRGGAAGWGSAASHAAPVGRGRGAMVSPSWRWSVGSDAARSASSGMSARTRTRSRRSRCAPPIAGVKIGSRSRTSPAGPTIIEPPLNILPPSLPTRFASDTTTPCSSAMSRTSRSQRATLAGPGTPSPRGQVPRAGAALEMNTTSAPCSAAMVPVSECHASSQTSIAARPHDVSNVVSSWPASTKRASSKRP